MFGLFASTGEEWEGIDAPRHFKPNCRKGKVVYDGVDVHSVSEEKKQGGTLHLVGRPADGTSMTVVGAVEDFSADAMLVGCTHSVPEIVEAEVCTLSRDAEGAVVVDCEPLDDDDVIGINRALNHPNVHVHVGERECVHCNLPWRHGTCHYCKKHSGGAHYFEFEPDVYQEHTRVIRSDDGVVHATTAAHVGFKDKSGQKVSENFQPRGAIGVIKNHGQKTVVACKTGVDADGSARIDCAAVSAKHYHTDGEPPRICPKTGKPIIVVMKKKGGAPRRFRDYHDYMRHHPDERYESAKKVISAAESIVDHICMAAGRDHEGRFSKLDKGAHWDEVRDGIEFIVQDVIERRHIDKKHEAGVLGRIKNSIFNVARRSLDYVHIKKHHKDEERIAAYAKKLKDARKELVDAIVEVAPAADRVYVDQYVDSFAVALRYLLFFPIACDEISDDKSIRAAQIASGIDGMLSQL
jgi:hypothetical protein